MNRFLCIALHDVAPATWPQCERLLEMLEELGATPLTLLVVPDYHGLGSIERHRDFLSAVDARLELGDEVALHGYTHHDDALPPRTLVQWIQRRLLTAGEGEFSALDRREAYLRITHGLAIFARLDWPITGFVPPAWLAGVGTSQALRATRMHYTSTHRSLIDLRSGRTIDAPVVTASSRSAWRRTTSRIWMRVLHVATKRTELLRIGLHPIDAEYPGIMRSWRQLIVDLLANRTPLTKAQAVAHAFSAADTLRPGFDVSGKTPSEL